MINLQNTVKNFLKETMRTIPDTISLIKLKYKRFKDVPLSWMEHVRSKMSFRNRVKSIIKKCREKGKWDLVARMCYKYDLTPMGESYYD